MTTREPVPEVRSNGHGPPVRRPAPGSEGRVGALRGAGVQFDGRRVAHILGGIVLATLAVLVVAFTVVGIHKNQQIDELRHHGVPVTFTVTGCLGLLGGSGSNAAGYSCHGTYVLDGHRHSERLPGSAFHAPGTRVKAVAVPGDPPLVSPVSIVDTEHSSGSVFVLPAVLLAILVLMVGGLWLRRRRGGGDRQDGATAPATH
jgi:hypothetical protein